MDAEAVARFLQENPAFFEQHPDLLAQISVPHPHGGPAIALADRQVLTLRERNRQLEAKLAELLQFGEENDVLGEKMHRLAVALAGTKTRDATLDTLAYNLREDLAIPHVALRLWLGNGEGRREFEPVSPELKQMTVAMAEPYCGPANQAEAASWLGESAPHLRSMALVALREHGVAGAQGDPIGLLVLASEDPARFYADMGTVYVRRLGELTSASLARFF